MSNRDPRTEACSTYAAAYIFGAALFGLCLGSIACVGIYKLLMQL